MHHNQEVDDVLNEMASVIAEYISQDDVRKLVMHWQKFDKVSVKMIQQCVLDTLKLYPEVQPYKYTIRKKFWGIVQSKIDISSNKNANTDISYNNYNSNVNNHNVNDSDNYTTDTNPVVVDKTKDATILRQLEGNTARRHNRAARINHDSIDGVKSIDGVNRLKDKLSGAHANNISEQSLIFYTVVDVVKQELNDIDIQVFFEYLHQMILKERTIKKRNINIMPFMYENRPPITDDVRELSILIQLIYASLCDIVGPSEADLILYKSADTAKQQYQSELVESLF